MIQANPAQDTIGHHSEAGRNVAADGGGLDGKNIFFAAVQMSRMPMCLADPNQPDMPLVFVNEAFLRQTGYAEHEVVGRNCRFLQGPGTDPAALQRLREAINAREDTAVELVNHRRDGTPFWNALYISPVFDAAGALIYFFASQLDVTRRKEAEAVLQQSQRMEALGSMASSVAHEFNNLMTVVVGSAQQAIERATDPKQRKQLDRVEWAARQAGRLTQQMLSFARRQFHDAHETDLNALVGDMDGLLAQVAGPGVAVALDLAPAPVTAMIDSGQMQLALINLARNAVDAMPDGGTLTVSTHALPDGTGAALAVADTGQGMAPEVLRRATEPFFTTKERGKGTGLGLSMVSGFAQQSGGQVEIDTAPGQGARITIKLPSRRPAGRATEQGPEHAG